MIQVNYKRVSWQPDLTLQIHLEPHPPDQSYFSAQALEHDFDDYTERFYFHQLWNLDHLYLQICHSKTHTHNGLS